MKKLIGFIVFLTLTFLVIFNFEVFADDDIVIATKYENGIETNIYLSDINLTDSDSTSPYIPNDNLVLPMNGLNVGNISDPNKLIGGIDNRNPVPSNQYTQAPYSMVCEIVLEYYVNSDVVQFHGTGFLVGPSTILTAAHVVYDNGSEHQYGWYDSIYIYFHGSLSNPITNIDTTSVIKGSYNGLIDNTTEDWALINLGINLGNTLGWFGLITNPEPNDSINVIGFPDEFYWQMYYGYGSIASVNGDYIQHTADTSQGQSGAPLVHNNYYSFGIHCGVGPGAIPTTNAACGINTYLLSLVEDNIGNEDD